MGRRACESIRDDGVAERTVARERDVLRRQSQSAAPVAVQERLAAARAVDLIGGLPSLQAASRNEHGVDHRRPSAEEENRLKDVRPTLAIREIHHENADGQSGDSREGPGPLDRSTTGGAIFIDPARELGSAKWRERIRKHRPAVASAMDRPHTTPGPVKSNRRAVAQH